MGCPGPGRRLAATGASLEPEAKRGRQSGPEHGSPHGGQRSSPHPRARDRTCSRRFTLVLPDGSRQHTAGVRLCAHTRTCSCVRMPPLYVRRGNGVPRAGGWSRPRRGSEGVRGPRSGDRSRTPRGRRPAGGPECVTRGPRGGSGCPPLQAPAHRPGFVLRFPHGRPARVWARPRAAALPTALGAGPSAWSYF